MKSRETKSLSTNIIILTIIFVYLPGCKMVSYALNPHPPKKNESTKLICPISEEKETKEDCPWAAITRKCELADSEYMIKKILTKYSPELVKGIINDAPKNSLKNVWGSSLNFDEMKKKIIVKNSIMNTILKLAKTSTPNMSKEQDGDPGQKVIVHAGLIHTYGYLFSNLLTDYGYKRARWVRDDIESGFKLPRGILGPAPTSGTLFANVTFFISNIAFRYEPEILLNIDFSDIPAILKTFNFKKLKIRRLKETVQLKNNKVIVLITDLVEFLKKRDENSNTHLLVYSYSDSLKKTPLLITTFPVSGSFGKSIFNVSRMGKNKIIKTRFNAFISDFTDSGKPHTGSRLELR